VCQHSPPTVDRGPPQLNLSPASKLSPSLEWRLQATANSHCRHTANRLFGVPKYLITDLGKEFCARLFRKVVARSGARQRFASKHNLYATARLERFWRSLKDDGHLRLDSPATMEDLERRLGLVLTYYLPFRPHQGLRGATPAEVFLGVEPACSHAVSPPRGRPAQGPTEFPFGVQYLDPVRRRFPILTKAA
jgi:hypothetical protein